MVNGESVRMRRGYLLDERTRSEWRGGGWMCRVRANEGERRDRLSKEKMGVVDEKDIGKGYEQCTSCVEKMEKKR